MAYMLLVVEKVGDREERSESEGRALYGRMLEFSAGLKERGLLRLSQSLKTDAAGVRTPCRVPSPPVMPGPARRRRPIGRKSSPCTMRSPKCGPRRSSP